MGVDDQQTQPPSAPATPPARRTLPSGFTTIRDLLVFAVGMAILGNEVFLSDTAEAPILALGAAMAGLPLVLGADERKGRGGGGEPP